jgi:hypothetical protein
MNRHGEVVVRDVLEFEMFEEGLTRTEERSEEAVSMDKVETTSPTDNEMCGGGGDSGDDIVVWGGDDDGSGSGSGSGSGRGEDANAES